MNGVAAFREAFLSADVLDDRKFSEFEARKMRYQIYWAFFEGSAYRNLHRWAPMLRAEFGLYKYIRSVYNPAYRLGEFWSEHLWGGQLDPAAGDGKSSPSALPIMTDNENLRPAIGKLWQWSNWQINKDIAPLWGATLGDAAIKIVDSVRRGKVYMANVHAGTLEAVTLDPWGNVKAYTITEERIDPRGNGNTTVKYSETAERGSGQDIIFRTFLNGQPYAWDDDGLSEWTEPYGFVPLVVIQHNNVGLSWGWSEIHAGLPKIREADDLASKLSDQVRKMVDSPWFYAGVSKPASQKTASGQDRTIQNPEPGREEIPAIFGPTGATATPLIAPLDIQATYQYIESILKSIEKDFPELAIDLSNFKGDVSGRALRINQKPAEVKVLKRRTGYDDALKRAQAMAIAIAGYRGYDPVFSTFNLESYAAGDLEHRIGARPVFDRDPLDDIETEGALWQTANQAKSAGLPLTIFLKRQGWSDEDIQALIDSPDYQARLAQLRATVVMGEAMGTNGPLDRSGQVGTDRNNPQTNGPVNG